MTTAKDWQLHDGREGPTGFTFGKAPRVRVHCYDKKLEVGKRSPLYRQAMIDRRWVG